MEERGQEGKKAAKGICDQAATPANYTEELKKVKKEKTKLVTVGKCVCPG